MFWCFTGVLASQQTMWLDRWNGVVVFVQTDDMSKVLMASLCFEDDETIEGGSSEGRAGMRGENME